MHACPALEGENGILGREGDERWQNGTKSQTDFPLGPTSYHELRWDPGCQDQGRSNQTEVGFQRLFFSFERGSMDGWIRAAGWIPSSLPWWPLEKQTTGIPPWLPQCKQGCNLQGDQASQHRKASLTEIDPGNEALCILEITSRVYTFPPRIPHSSSPHVNCENQKTTAEKTGIPPKPDNSPSITVIPVINQWRRGRQRACVLSTQ